jgi:hypothetical protein
MDGDFPWLKAPILNERTRLVMVMDAKEGRFVAQGFEAGSAATNVLQWAA